MPTLGSYGLPLEMSCLMSSECTAIR
jgi:hypothetical protein